MPLSAIKSRYVQHAHARLCQGDVLRDVVLLEAATDSEGELDVFERTLPYVVVLTQDCDLEQDDSAREETPKKNDDKHLQSVLLCPAYQSMKVRAGTHLQELGLTMQAFGKELWRPIAQNSAPRYHMLPEETGVQLPELVLDFKQYFTSPREFFCARYKTHYVTTLGPLFRESLSQRFAQYLSRIGLPEFEVAKPAPVLAQHG
ncbi:MAG: hypothetical protein ABI885_10535 [Gammaproteobacteria bacterium]